jgi:hypothetical protein
MQPDQIETLRRTFSPPPTASMRVRATTTVASRSPSAKKAKKMRDRRQPRSALIQNHCPLFQSEAVKNGRSYGRSEPRHSTTQNDGEQPSKSFAILPRSGCPTSRTVAPLEATAQSFRVAGCSPMSSLPVRSRSCKATRSSRRGSAQTPSSLEACARNCPSTLETRSPAHRNGNAALRTKPTSRGTRC